MFKVNLSKIRKRITKFIKMFGLGLLCNIIAPKPAEPYKLDKIIVIKDQKTNRPVSLKRISTVYSDLYTFSQNECGESVILKEIIIERTPEVFER